MSPETLETARPFVVKIARKYVSTDHELEDVVQDAMLLAHRHRDSYRGDSAYGTWLYRLVVNAALSYLKRRKYRLAEVSSSEAVDGDGTPLLDLQPSLEDTASATVARSELARVRRAVDALGETCASVFWPAVELGMTEPEIAREHGLSVSAVKARIHRARRAAIANLSAS